MTTISPLPVQLTTEGSSDVTYIAVTTEDVQVGEITTVKIPRSSTISLGMYILIYTK